MPINSLLASSVYC